MLWKDWRTFCHLKTRNRYIAHLYCRMFLWFHVGLLNDLHLASKPRPRSSSARRAMPFVNQERLVVKFELTIRTYHGVGTCASVLTLRCSQISLFKGRKLIIPPPLSPPPLPLIIIHWWMIDFINQSRLSGAYRDCNTLRGLIQDGLFTTWKFKFVFDFRPHHLRLLVLEFFHFTF